MMSGYARKPPVRDSVVVLLTLTILIGVTTDFPASQMGLFSILHRLIVNPHPWLHGNSIPDHIEYRNHYGDDVPAYVQGDHRWLALPSNDHPKTDYDHDLPVEVIEQRRAAIASLKHGKTDAFFDQFVQLLNYFQHPDLLKASKRPDYRHTHKRDEDGQLAHPPHQVIYKFRLPRERLTTSDYRAIMFVHHYASLMDDCFRVPCTDVRFGFGPLFTVIPVIGDLADLAEYAVNLTIWVYIPFHCGAWRILFGKAFKIEIINMFYGFIPVLGAWYQAQSRPNRRNARLLECFMSVRSAMATDEESQKGSKTWRSERSSAYDYPVTLADYLGEDVVEYPKKVRAVFMGRHEEHTATRHSRA